LLQSNFLSPLLIHPPNLLTEFLEFKFEIKIVRASPTGEANKELNLKMCIFNFSFFTLQLQRSREKESQNGYSICEKLFLQVSVEIAKMKLPLPTTIFIAVGQQFFFL